MPRPDDDLLADLTPAQREAVTHFEGPLLVLAGPGSGKTRVITRRVAHLLRQGVRPGNILAITFTNKAAGEMRNRVEALVPGTRVWMSTFHAFGARLLRQYHDRLELDRNFTIYDVGDRKRLIKSAVEAADLDTVRFTPDRIEAAISKAKNDLLGPERYAGKADDFFKQVVARVYPVYEKKMRDANALDFDDLLMWPALALKNDPELRSELDSRFRFVLIDEYQDTNHAQYAIARGLSVDQPNLCVVGDPNQSIYRFRGSDIRNILDFERDFPNARVIGLDYNYRSTQAILKAASTLIAHNTKRRHLDLHTDNPHGSAVGEILFETGQDEAEMIARRVREAAQTGKRTYRDVAVFMRMNALSRALEQAFVKQGVPFQIVKGLAFFERKENRDVLAYLRLLLNPRDDVAFERVVNEPPRGVGKVSLERLKAYAEPRELSLLSAAEQIQKIPQIKGKAAGSLAQFAALIRDLAKYAEYPPDQVIQQVLERTGYKAMFKGSTDAEDEERLANIEELVTAARQFAGADGGATLRDFLENITLASDLDGWDENQDRVSVMTLHSSKGLEFPVVYVVAVEQGILPHERSLNHPEELDEERRLAFVGMTRAKEELYLCRARLREYRGSTLYAVPSQFLDELDGLPEEVLQRQDMSSSAAGTAGAIAAWRSGGAAAAPGWAEAGITPRKEDSPQRHKEHKGEGKEYEEGMVVQHDTYGKGKVTEVGGYGALRKVKVRFAAAGERTFLVEKAKLTIVGKT
jgi:DNA helicase II / ATP-dependent DNA helicase PcrA